jgi:deferrochelatase/peroxidase EfeB
MIALGADPTRNNNFDYNHLGSLITTDQSECPFAAHIRKTRPRGDLFNTNIINQAIRAGIPYGPEVSSSESSSSTTTQDRGLAFGTSSTITLLYTDADANMQSSTSLFSPTGTGSSRSSGQTQPSQ